MAELWQGFLEVWRDTTGQVAIKVIAALLGCLVGYRLLARLPALGRLHPQHQLVARRILFVLATVVAAIFVLNILGVGIGVLLGTAGVLTVIVGFAAQTSASNMISGFFLMAERPFRVGDVIRVGGLIGEVVSVELLSVRLRTFDNLLVRVANEEVLKTPVTNLTHAPIRRIDVPVKVPYGSDLDQVTAALEEACAAHPFFLIEPAPLIMILGLGEYAIELQVSVWTTTDSFVESRSQIHREILDALAARDIEIPMPERALSAGRKAAPLPVRVVGDR